MPLYADPGWIAANFAALWHQIVEGLRRRGVDADQAAEAVQEAVVRLYKVRPDLRTQREVARWLTKGSFWASKHAQEKMARHDLRAELGEDEAALGEAEARLEAAEALRAALEELPRLRPTHRGAVLRVLRDELVAMGAFDEAAALEQAIAVAPAEINVAQARMLLRRAQDHLRGRLRGWLVGIPVLRGIQRRQAGPVAEARVLAMTAVVVVTATSLVAVLPEASGGRSLRTVEQVVTAPAHDAPPDGQPPLSDVVDEAETDVRRPAITEPGDVLPPPAEPPPPVPALLVPDLGEGGARVTASTGDRNPGNTDLVCVRRVPGVGDRCVAHPLLGDPLGVERQPAEK